MFVTALLAALSAPVPKGLQPKDGSLDGAWELVGVAVGGRDPEAPAGVKPVVWAVAGEAVTKRWPGLDAHPGSAFALRRRSDIGPQAVDYHIRQRGRADEVRECAAVLDGDTLRLCWRADGAGRPADCTPRDGQVMFVFRRADATK